jgi:hypothetical protein
MPDARHPPVIPDARHPPVISDAIIKILAEAICDGRLRVSCSESVYRAPSVLLIHRKAINIASCRFNCNIAAEYGVLLQLQGKAETPLVNANLFGDAGVWIQIHCRDFWMEIYAPTLTTRQQQLRRPL